MAEQGLAESREQAQVLIMEGLVFTRAGHVLKASSLLTLGDAIEGWPGAVCALLAAGLATAGVVIERWLFFAEATHTVTLYYGAPEA